jgi:hypothetical protein
VTSDEEQVKALGKSEAMYYAAARMPDLLRRFVDDGLVGAGDPASGNFKAMVDTYDPTTQFVVVGCEDNQLFVHIVTGHDVPVGSRRDDHRPACDPVHRRRRGNARVPSRHA